MQAQAGKSSWLLRLSRSYLARGAAPLAVAWGASFALALLRNVILAHALSKTDFGLVNYLYSIASVVVVLYLPGLNTAVTQYVAAGHRRVLGPAVRWRFGGGVVAALVLVLVGYLISLAKAEPSLLPVTVAMAVVVPVTGVYSLIGAYWNGEKRFGRVAFTNVGDRVMRVIAACLVLLIVRFRTAFAVVLAQELLLAALTAGLLVVLWLDYREKNRAEGVPAQTPSKKFLTYGNHMTVLGVINILQLRTGQIVVGSFLSFAAAADFAVAVIAFNQAKQLFLLYQTVSYPRLMQLEPAKRLGQLRREAKVVIPIILGILVVVGATLKWTVAIFFSGKYENAIPLILILFAGFTAVLPGTFAELYFRSTEAYKELYAIRVTGAGVGVVLPLALVFPFGLYGVAVGVLVADIAYTAVSVGLALRVKRRQEAAPSC